MLIKIILFFSIMFIVDRFLLWLEQKGYLFYRKRKPQGGFVGNALLELNCIFQPSSRHIIEVKQKARRVKPSDSDSFTKK